MLSEKSNSFCPTSAGDFGFEKDDFLPPPPPPGEKVSLIEYEEKIKKTLWEKEAGNLISRDEVERSAFLIGRILREKLCSMPYRLAPKLSEYSDEKRNFEILRKEMNRVIREIQYRVAEAGRFEHLSDRLPAGIEASAEADRFTVGRRKP